MRVGHQLSIAVWVALVVVSGACSEAHDGGIAPTELATSLSPPPRSVEGTCTPDMIICEGGNSGDVPSWSDDGYEEVFTAEASGDAAAVDVSESFSEAQPAPACPSFAYATGQTTTVSVTNPAGNLQSVQFLYTGTFTFLGYVGPTSGEYIWPSGWFPATDGSGILVSVNTCHANCYKLINLGVLQTYRIAPTRFFGVQARFPRRRGYLSPTSGGGSITCTYEYLIVEVKVDGGNWTPIWAGWVMVCP